MRVACNMTANGMGMGLMMTKSATTLKRVQDFEEAEADEVVTFDFGEMNEIRGDCS